MLKIITFVALMLYSPYLYGESLQERSEGDLYYLAEAIYWEARGEPFAGQVAVAQNIIHRLDSSKFPDSIEEIVHKKNKSNVCAYSYYCDGESDEMLDEVAKKESFRVASLVLNKEIPDLIDKADHYFNDSLVTPYWSSKMTFIIKIGQHSFYRSNKVW